MAMSPRLLRPRATGFNPKSISGLALWLDAQDSATMFDADTGGSAVLADGTVGRWTDKSGNSRNVSQSVANNRPTLKTGVINGKSVLRFDGSNDFLAGASATSDVPFPYSLFVVYKSSDTAGTFAGFTRISGTFVAECVRKSAANTLQLLNQNGSTQDFANVTAADGSWHVGEAVFSGTASSMTFTVRANGGTTGNTTTARARNATAVDRRLEIGTVVAAGTAGDLLDGDIAEVIAYGRTLTVAELSQVRKYLGNRYGITVT